MDIVEVQILWQPSGEILSFLSSAETDSRPVPVVIVAWAPEFRAFSQLFRGLAAKKQQKVKEAGFNGVSDSIGVAF